ncbi:MAG: SPFH domain-containing protein, partial [Firmicutes bacterium]|nr:SPFH domain-containing protein [Bacillota bacterium]
AYTDPNLAMAYTVASRGKALQDAANNAAGAATGLMGMGMVGGMGGQDNMMQTLMQMQQAQQAQQMQSGMQVNQPAVTQQQAPAGWTCSCGNVNTGKFCSECGSAKPAAAQFKCDKCGWQPEPGAQPPKFCPECGDKFDGNDIG